MELGDYIRILRKRWWIILVAVAFTAGSAYVFSKIQHPQIYGLVVGRVGDLP